MSASIGPTFAIATLVNDREQHAAMRDSFEQAGFVGNRARYIVFDNTSGNVHDPYRVIGQVLAAAREPFVVFCHQDVRADQGDGCDDLVQALDDLTAHDPGWAVAGNAGGTPDLQVAARITDSFMAGTMVGRLPARVLTLDENFMVVRTSSRLTCSDELSGFHMYGPDLCFRAEMLGFTSYVVDFHVRHICGSSLAAENYHHAVRRFRRTWDPRFALRYVRTTSTAFALSRHLLLRATLCRPRVVEWIVHHPDKGRALLRLTSPRKGLRNPA